MKEAFGWLSKTLVPPYEEREAAFIAGLVMEKVTRMSRLDRITRPETLLPEQQLSELQRMLGLLKKDVPIQYVLGEAWFYGMPLHVDEHVLIPRPETEELVSWILEDEKKEVRRAGPVRVLDIGTGSGCIAIALKKNLGKSEVFAIDKSADALTVARENAARQEADIHFLEADALKKDALDTLPPVDVIVSNPPYIPLSEKPGLQARVADHEPPLALFVPGDDPLVFYRAILEASAKRLQQGGKLYVEIHEDRGAEVEALFRELGFTGVILRQDLNGRDRMVTGVKA
jgi:release factor glutamine methyltransferase